MHLDLFDVQTILFMNVLICACLSVALFFNIRDRYVCPGIWYWFGAFISLTAGLFFLWLRLHVSLWISVVFGNGLIILSYIQLWLGLRQYTKSLRPHDKLLMLLAPSVSLVLFALLNTGEDSFIIRSQVVAYTLLCLIVMSITLALKNRKPTESGRLLFACSLLLALGNAFFRTFALHLLPGNSGLLDTNLQNVILMTTSEVSLLASGFSIMIISSQWLQQRLYVHATYDSLTGIYNRYALIELSETIALTTNLTQRVWSLAMIDIDHFKAVNDQYGHPVGDIVLKQIATTLKENIRHRDILARYGGEEFVVVLPDCDTANAKTWAERTRKIIENKAITIHGQYLHVTVSIGVATSNYSILGLDDVIKLADQALYAAKKAGRNQVQTG